MRRLTSALELDAYELVRLVPPFGVLVVWAVMMFDSGGFDPSTWLPAGVVLTGLLAVSMIGQRQILPPHSAARTALLLLAAFTGWCFLSLLWSDAPGTSWQAADLLLIALLAGWTLALTPWRSRTAEVFGLGLSTAAVAACVAALVSALGVTDLSSRFEDFRFTPPLDYSNATAGFCFMAAVPPLVAAARPGSIRLVKGLGMGLSTFLCAYALLPESRGSILGGLAVLVILGLAVPFRWRLLMRIGLLLICVLIAAGPVIGVYTAASKGENTHDALSSATLALFAASLVATAGGVLLAHAEDRISLGSRGRRRARYGALAAGALLALGIVGAGVAKSSSISDTLHDQWRSLRHPGVNYAGGEAKAGATSGRLISADPLERYDYWRVSLDGFRAAPVWGMGAGGFEHRYALDRRYPKPSRYPHNLVMKVIGDTGLVGTGLIVAFLVVLVRALVRGGRRRAQAERAVAATALAVLGYFVAHGEFDWLEIYPVLVGPALGLPLIALAVNARADHLGRLGDGSSARAPAPLPVDAPRPTWPPRGKGLPRGAMAGVGVGALLVALVLLGPWLSLRYRDRASGEWRTAPGVAYADLGRAADLDPLSPEPLVLKGVIGLTRGDLEQAEDGFRRALEREQAWLPHFGLGVVAAARGDRARAQGEIDRARALNRLDPVLKRVAPRVLGPAKVNPSALIRDVLVTPFLSEEKVQ